MRAVSLFFGKATIDSLGEKAVARAQGDMFGRLIRRDLVERIGCGDWPIALAEDLIAVACAGFAMHVVTN